MMERDKEKGGGGGLRSKKDCHEGLCGGHLQEDAYEVDGTFSGSPFISRYRDPNERFHLWIAVSPRCPVKSQVTGLVKGTINLRERDYSRRHKRPASLHVE